MVMAAQLWQSSEQWIVYLERVNLRFMNYISIKLLETFFAPPRVKVGNCVLNGKTCHCCFRYVHGIVNFYDKRAFFVVKFPGGKE